MLLVPMLRQCFLLKFHDVQDHQSLDVYKRQVEKLAVWDEYETDYTIFNVCGNDIRVYDDELAEALKKLPERKRDNVLMYYFLELSLSLIHIYVIVWSIEQSETDTFSATYEVDQQIKEGEPVSYTHLDVYKRQR